jgi:ABC-type Fe3+/spermidine/putrescine transport system ATPase subunit
VSQVLVTVDTVTKEFGAVTALDGVSLEIPAGSFFSLLGPSGCGKTTLLRILAGFESPTSGDVLLDGRPVTSVPPERRPFNIVFQHYALFPHLSVHDNVAFGLTTGGRRRRRSTRGQVEGKVQAMLDLVGLSTFGDRRPGQLSGGQAQRVALARALINEPRLLLLDEPLSALDQKVRLTMRESLLRIQRESDTTFLFVTHDQEEALSMSTTVALMDSGSLDQVASPDVLYREPASLFGARFIGTGSFIDVAVAGPAGDRVEVKAGDVTWCPKVVGEVGSTGVAFLRPEELRLTGDDGRRLGGTVRTVVFLGSEYEIVVTSPVGDLRLRTHQAPAVGDLVSVGWESTSGRCYAARATA